MYMYMAERAGFEPASLKGYRVGAPRTKTVWNHPESYHLPVNLPVGVGPANNRHLARLLRAHSPRNLLGVGTAAYDLLC